MTSVEQPQLLALPPELTIDVDTLRAVALSGRRMVILDDDPTGTQTVRDLPVLTRWAPPDVRWAFDQETPAFFVETNSRSLAPVDAAARNREIVDVVAQVAAELGVDFVVCSRGDSTLRGHFDVETEGLGQDVERATGRAVDAVLVVPAYVEAGRITIDARHYASSAGTLVPVGETEYARDATFGYTESDLPRWIAEVTRGRVEARDVETISIRDIREGGAELVRQTLSRAHGRRYIAVDAVSDADLQVVAAGVLQAESEGCRFLYRVGPSFVRARVGQTASQPLDLSALTQLGGGRQPGTGSVHGLVVVGSHVPTTSRQLAALLAGLEVTEIEVSVDAVIEAFTGDGAARLTSSVAAQAAEALPGMPVVIRTSRQVVTGRDPQESLAISRTVSSALVSVVRQILAAVRPAFVVAKGGITSSDVGTLGLQIRRAWVRGTALPGIVSIWEPVEGPARGVPYVVFAGNVGADRALLGVVSSLETALA